MKVKKSILTFAVLLMIALSSSGQSYEPVLSSDSTTWNIAWKELFGNVMGNLYSVANKDSIYHDLYFESLYPNPEYVGKIREDTVSGRIWYTPPEKDKSEEYLIMDLTLEVGDIFDLPIFNTTIPIEVVNVYYVNQRKSIEFDYQTEWDEPLQFIEGVGRNIAMHQFWIGDFTYVSCKYNLDELVYVNSNPNFIGCELDPTGIRPTNSNFVQLYPNPATNILNIDFGLIGKQDITVSVFNDNGMEVCNNKTTDGHITLQLTTFNKGLYLIKISNKNNLITSKFIIQ